MSRASGLATSTMKIDAPTGCKAFVTLRFAGDDLDPRDISAILPVAPTRAHHLLLAWRPRRNRPANPGSVQVGRGAIGGRHRNRFRRWGDVVGWVEQSETHHQRSLGED